MILSTSSWQISLYMTDWRGDKKITFFWRKFMWLFDPLCFLSITQVWLASRLTESFLHDVWHSHSLSLPPHQSCLCSSTPGESHPLLLSSSLHPSKPPARFPSAMPTNRCLTCDNPTRGFPATWVYIFQYPLVYLPYPKAPSVRAYK